MGLGLIKTTASPSGDYTPNLLISSLFELTPTGSVHIKLPTNVGSGGQVFVIVLLQPGTTNFAVTWDAGYQAQGSLFDQTQGQDSVAVTTCVYNSGYCVPLSVNGFYL